MERLKRCISNKAFLAFVSGALIYILVVLPELIAEDGILMYVGDYSTQTIPFTHHIRDALFSGNVIWDHGAGTGAQFLSSYAYYNLCSPFSVIYLLMPRSWVIYAIPYVTALKYGTGALTAYFYIKRFLKNGHYAVIGGVIYSLSSFSAYNMVFHFTDIIALFPLLLIGLEELCVNRRRIVFALACTLMAYVNYFFFFGQAIFVVIYYFVRATDKDFGFSFRQLASVAAEAVIGVMLAAPMMAPVVVTLLDSEKATGIMSASGLLLYDDIFHYLKIIQSAFMVPDGFYFISLFPEDDVTYPFGTFGASLAAYLPMFSAAGVISYIFARRKKWESILLSICVVMAFVPVLNQMFSAFNSAYYARWLYMPMLIGSMVSLKALEERVSFRPGIIASGSVLGAMLIYQIVVDTDKLITTVTAHGSINRLLNYVYFAISVIGLISMIIVAVMKRDKEFIPKLYILAYANVYMCFGIMVYYTLSFDNYDLYDKYYNLEPSVEFQESQDRVLLCNRNIINHNLVFSKNSPAYFNSIYDNGHIRFFQENELVNSNETFKFISIHDRELMDALAVRYFYDVPNSGGTIVRMTYLCEDYPYIIYENDSYIPMGTTYDMMISHEDFSELSKIDKHRVYAKYLVADDPAEFADILEVYGGDLTISDEEYEKQIALRQENAALSTEQVRDGYVSQLELDSEELVFYSISYNDSWKAYIDGKEADVYEVNNGLVGVRVPEGRHEVKLSYSVKGAGAGMLIFGAGAASLAVYLYICKRKPQVSE